MAGLTKDQIDEYHECFSLFDKNKDGSIPITDLGTLMHSVGDCATQEEIHKIINQLGKPVKIDFATFQSIMVGRPKQSISEADIVAAFQTFDKERRGFVSVSDLHHVLTNIGEKLTEAEAKEFLSDADDKNQGNIYYEEYIKKMISPLLHFKTSLPLGQ